MLKQRTSSPPPVSPPTIHRPTQRNLLFASLICLGLCAGASIGQPISSDPYLAVYPQPARALEPVRIVFSWFTISCAGDPVLQEASREPGRIVMELLDPGCPLLPPGGYEYTIVQEIEIAGSTTVEIRQPGDLFVAEVDVEVTPVGQDELRLTPQTPRFKDTERVRVALNGDNGGCLVSLESIDFAPSSIAPSDGPTPIDIELGRGCIVDPPLSHPFTRDLELGLLPAGLYEITARFAGGETSRTELIDVYVDTEPASLSVSPTEPVETDQIQVAITRPGQLVCDPNPEVQLGTTRIDVLLDSGCWGAPFDQSSTVFATVPPRSPDRYLLVVVERDEPTELDRLIFDVEFEGQCEESISSLCLLRNRFRATAIWRTSQGTQGPGHALLRNDGNSAASGTFWFFDPNSVEIDLKIINGCSLNGNFWVFAAGLTDQGVALTVEDTVTGERKVYGSSPGAAFQAITDIGALRCL